MKKLFLSILVLGLLLSGNGYAKEYMKDLDFKDANYIHSKHDVKYFIKIV
tara:strand:- start:426 stop:575 length:150 start_codon:yes stop_codon:yes gene_type:complete